MTLELNADCLILGGGIAGLWCLDTLVRSGYRAVLFSHGALAAGQTMSSQGIIHGGTKYTLEKAIGRAAESLSAMPARWRACLAGRGETDLSEVTIAANRHLMWLPAQFAGAMMRFFASKAMAGRSETLGPANYPAVFSDPAFQGAILALDEVVLDVPSLVALFARRHGARIFDSAKFSDLDWRHGPSGVSLNFRFEGAAHRLACDHLVAAAGAGNEALARTFQLADVGGQRRPLRMVLLRHAPGELWAHCVVKQKNPRFTITSHRAADGARIWYIGGDIAERGAQMSPADGINLARRELAELLPWLNFEGCQWASVAVDRAEARQPGRGRPDTPVLLGQGPIHLAWPTKLAFAPLLADQILAKLVASGGAAPRGGVPDPGFTHLSPPVVATPVWDEAGLWN